MASRRRRKVLTGPVLAAAGASAVLGALVPPMMSKLDGLATMPASGPSRQDDLLTQNMLILEEMRALYAAQLALAEKRDAATAEAAPSPSASR